MSSTESRAAARDRALRTLHLTTGIVTVAAMGATGAITGALVPPQPAAAPTSQQSQPTPMPLPHRTIHVPSTSSATAVVVRARRNASTQAPVATTGSS
ncbi:MAG: hypothetical protein JWM02_294 [Frankiales bacterium]|nr:hypothetical protein [Frankiales bacterium]